MESGVSENAVSGHIQLIIPGETACFAVCPIRNNTFIIYLMEVKFIHTCFWGNAITFENNIISVSVLLHWWLQPTSMRRP